MYLPAPITDHTECSAGTNGATTQSIHSTHPRTVMMCGVWCALMNRLRDPLPHDQPACSLPSKSTAYPLLGVSYRLRPGGCVSTLATLTRCAALRRDYQPRRLSHADLDNALRSGCPQAILPQHCALALRNSLFPLSNSLRSIAARSLARNTKDALVAVATPKWATRIVRSTHGRCPIRRRGKSASCARSAWRERMPPRAPGAESDRRRAPPGKRRIPAIRTDSSSALD